MNSLRSIEAKYTLTPEELEAIMTAMHHTNEPLPALRITPNDNIISGKTGTLKNTSYAQIEQVLGFPPNVKDDPYKVAHSWGFEIDGHPCAIWDWKGSWEADVWSIHDPHHVLYKLFGLANVEEI